MKDKFDQFSRKFAKLLGNSRARIVMLIIVVVIIVGIILGIYRLTSGADVSSGSQIAGIPSNIQSVPGGRQESQQYLQTLLKSNQLAAKSALSQGTSEIPTLVSTPNTGAGSSYNSQAVKSGGSSACCCKCGNCCEGASGSSKPGVNSVLNSLESSGAISPQTADAIRKLNAEDLTPAQYAAHLKELVAEGKLTPAQAKALLAAYKNDYKKHPKSANDIADSLLASGAISAGTAKQLKALANEHLTPAQYAAQLNKLVREGKLSPAAAARLMAAYQKQYGKKSTASTASSPDDVVDGLLSSGAIDAATAAQLKKLNHSNLTPAQYAAALQKLVREGKLTPEQARRLLAAYKLSHAGSTAAGKNLPSPGDLANQLAQSGQINDATAQKLNTLNGRNLSPEAYRKALQAMVADGDLTQAQADKLAASYAAHHLKNAGGSDSGLIRQLSSSGALTPGAASVLQNLVRHNATPEQYAQALKNLVASGQLDPATAARLLQNYMGTHPLKGGTGLKGIRASQEKQDLERQIAGFQQQAQQQQNESDKQAQAQLQTAESAMRSQASQLIASWKSPKQLSMDAAENKKKGAGSSASGSSSGKSGSSTTIQKQMIKAGDILFAVLNTSVNSDRPGPVMATIVAGKYKGAKLLGKLQLTPDSERVILTFTRMTMPKWPASIQIQAVAINPDTAQTAIASNVNHHYLLRYSALFASSFLQGYSTAITTSGSTSVNSGFGSSTVTHPDLSPINKIMVGLGQVGQNASSAAQQEFDRKPTVTVDSGVGLGVLFTQGVTKTKFGNSAKSKGAK